MKRKNTFEGVNKLAIIEEYLTGEDSYATLGKKYGISHETIKSWVRSYRKSLNKPTDHQQISADREKELIDKLEKERLKNELLEEIIKLSGQATGIDLRKKFGSKR